MKDTVASPVALCFCCLNFVTLSRSRLYGDRLFTFGHLRVWSTSVFGSAGCVTHSHARALSSSVVFEPARSERAGTSRNRLFDCKTCK